MPYRPTIILSLVAWCRGGSERDPAIRACQIFCGRGSGEPTSGGKFLLEQKQAVQQWDKLLKACLPRAGADVAGDQPLHPALRQEKRACCSHHAIHAEAV